MSSDTSSTVMPGSFTVFRPGDAPMQAVPGQEGHEASAVWRSPDGTKMVGSYRIRQGGAVFDFEGDYHESTYILSGLMIVTLEDGSRHELRAGDLAQVLPGVRSRIEVVETVHDFFVISSADGRPLDPM